MGEKIKIKKVTGHRPPTKHNLLSPIPKNEQTVMVRDELMAFTAVLRFGSQQVQNIIQ